MIVDAHVHVWENWPYLPEVPDPGRARVEQLLHEMDANGVERSVIICARIGENASNVDYALEAAHRYQGRFTVFPDLECKWAADFRSTGAVGRLEKAMARWDFVGFTMYLDEAEDGSWLTNAEGLAFFELAAASRLIVSLSAMPHQMPAVMRLAAEFQSLPILLHHFAFLGPRSAATTNGMELVLAAAGHRNIFVKYSGMGNVAAPDQDYPYPELAGIPRQLHRTFGAHRLMWGSDYPVSRKHMTYTQTMRLAERHGPLGAAELAPVMGGNITRLLEERAIAT